MNIPDYIKSKNNGLKHSWVTCYDYTSAKLVAKSDVTGVLIGDSVAMTMYGYPDTLSATTQMIAAHTQAVAKGLAGTNKIIIADLPFLSFRGSLDQLLSHVGKLMRAGAHGVKIEGAKGNLKYISHLVESGVPVMGHLGLTPQSFHQLGGYKVQGKSDAQKKLLLEDAKALQNAGCFSLVLECVPTLLGKEITKEINIPTIGIGAGPNTDGQILVWQDLLGFNSGYLPKFVRPFLNGQDQVLKALGQFNEAVLNSSYPNVEESYNG